MMVNGLGSTLANQVLKALAPIFVEAVGKDYEAWARGADRAFVNLAHAPPSEDSTLEPNASG